MSDQRPTPEVIEAYVRELRLREDQGERSVIEIGPATALMLVAALQWVRRRPEFAGQGQRVYQGLIDQLTELFADDPLATAMIQLDESPPAPG